MTVISFENYFVDELIYTRNENLDRTIRKFDIESEISAEIYIDEENSEAVVKLIAKLGSLEKEDSPFLVKVIVSGLFTFNSEEDEQELGFEHYLSSNSVAILYPYLRGLVSDLTTRSNEFPTFVLPVANIYEMLKNSDAIKILRK